jgi:hypothetical protein
MAFLKHIGKHGDRKIVVIFRQLPGDEHMCLCIYPDLLATHWHDSIMRVLESPIGQAAEEFADALHRNLLPDGRTILGALHAERMMKRVNTEQVLMTPTMNSNVKLSELNNILNEMKKGEAAVRKMAEIESTWRALSLDFVPHKDGDVRMPRASDEIIEFLDTHQMELQAIISMGRVVDFFRERGLWMLDGTPAAAAAPPPPAAAVCDKEGLACGPLPCRWRQVSPAVHPRRGPRRAA